MQNQEANIASINLQQNLINNKEKMNKYNQVYEDEFISLINGLNESIKEYYKVSRNNINEANSLLSFYEQQGKGIQALMDEIKNANSYERINEVFVQIPKINEIMTQLQMNTNSNEHNLNLFFEDGKILFKKMKMNRKQKIEELNNYNYINSDISTYNVTNQGLNDSFTNSFRVNQSRNLEKNNLIYKNNTNMQKNNPGSFSQINLNKNSNQTNSILNNINNKYSQILTLLNNLSEFNFMINKMNFEASNRYSNLQRNLKIELDILMNYLKNSLTSRKNNNAINGIKSFNNMEDVHSFNQRSKSIPSKFSKEIEKLKQINQMKEKKIKDLNNQLITFRAMSNARKINNMNNIPGLSLDSDNKIRELEIKVNNLNMKLIVAEQQLREKDSLIMSLKNNYQNKNSPNNLMKNNMNMNNNNVLKLKDQIINLQQQLSLYQNNENVLNSQITDLNNKFQMKINQYESQLSLLNNKNSSLSQMILNKNKEILKYQTESNEMKKEI